MGLHSRNLRFIFLITLLLTLFGPVLLPSLPLFFFAPFLVISFYQKTLQKCLLSAALCGIIIDLLSADERLGIYALSFSVATLICYRLQKHFFSDSASTLPIMTLFFSSVATVVGVVLKYALTKAALPSLTMQWVFTDVLVMPAMDAVYAYVCFVLPARAMFMWKRA